MNSFYSEAISVVYEKEQAFREEFIQFYFFQKRDW
jgi:hypothetical protein